MIKATYNIELTQYEFEALKEIVQEHYNKAESCSVSTSNVYDMFKVERETTVED